MNLHNGVARLIMLFIAGASLPNSNTTTIILALTIIVAVIWLQVNEWRIENLEHQVWVYEAHLAEEDDDEELVT